MALLGETKMKKINKKAFTLAEALVVMFIIAVVALAALHNMTKKAPLRSDEAQHGQYACWYDPAKDRVCEQGAVGRRVDSERCLGKCTFIPDRKIGTYTIYIVGAGVAKGSNNVQGQFVSGSFGGADFKEDVTIQFNAKDPAGGDLKGTLFGDRSDLFARNGKTNVSNGLITENIKSCRLVKAEPTNQCVKSFASEYLPGDSPIRTLGAPLGCSIVGLDSDSSIGQSGRAVRIDGCKALVRIENEYTNDGVEVRKAYEIDALIKTDELTFVGNRNNEQDRDKREYKGRVHDESNSTNTEYIIKVQLLDSDYTTMPPPDPSKPEPVSKMATLLDPLVLPKFRRSEITDKLHDTSKPASISPGFGAGKGGAVFIMW